MEDDRVGEIIKRELFISFALFFWPIVIFTCHLIGVYGLPANFYTAIGIPLVTTLLLFVISVKLKHNISVDQIFASIKKKDILLAIIILNVIHIIIKVIYAVITFRIDIIGLCASLILLVVCLRWYKQTEGAVDLRKFVTRLIYISTFLIILGLLMGISPKGISLYALIWFSCWIGLLIVSLIMRYRVKGG